MKGRGITTSVVTIAVVAILVVAGIGYYFLGMKPEAEEEMPENEGGVPENEEEMEVLTLIVEVPQTTPEEDTIYVDIDQIYVEHPIGLRPMQKIGDNRWSINLAVGEDNLIRYYYMRNGLGFIAAEEFTPDNKDKRRELEVKELPMVQNDIVEKWRWIPSEPLTGYQIPDPPVSVPSRIDNGSFLTGVDLLDFYWPEFDPLIENTIKNVKDMNADWVWIGWVYAVSQANPPKIEASGNTMSEETFRKHVSEARKQGLKVSVAIMTDEDIYPGVSKEIYASLSTDWFDEYFSEFNKLHQEKIPILNELGVEMLVLSPNGFFNGDANLVSYVDQKMSELIQGIRENYSGVLTSDWLMSEYFNFYSDLDYVGHKWSPSLSASATSFEAMAQEISAKVESELRPLYQKYQKPIFIAQIAYESYDGAAQKIYGGDDPQISEFEPYTGDPPIDLQEQVNLYAAVLDAFAKTPWIKGAFVFGYSYWDSASLSASVRGKPAEEMFTRWFEVL